MWNTLIDHSFITLMLDEPEEGNAYFVRVDRVGDRFYFWAAHHRADGAGPDPGTQCWIRLWKNCLSESQSTDGPVR